MAFTLTLLGTDTKFSPGPIENEYDKAETLSYVSTLIKGDERKPDDVIKFRNSNIAVIDGPTTTGTEVGDRIVRGVQAVLEAISRGETKISIIAHSRGAVEAIIVAHELERIKNEWSKIKADRALLTKSASQSAETAMNSEQYHANFNALNFEKIDSTIANVRLSIFNIDPVPGGNYIGITRPTTLAWQDPLFYTVPPIVVEYEQYTYENERTRCFKAIVPKCASSETKFKHQSIPGHHGTGSGNLKDQQRNEIPKALQLDNSTPMTTEHVQQLLLIKVIDFLQRNEVKITPETAEKAPFASVIPIKDNKIDPLQFTFHYHKLYKLILANKAAYQHFNNTSYRSLGQEQSFKQWFGKRVDQRIVHNQGHNDTYLESIIPPVPGGHFLNHEHARIEWNSELGLNDKVPLHQTLTKAVERFLQLCNHTKQLSELSKKTITESELNVSTLNDKMALTLSTQEGFTLFLEGLNLLIEEVKQPYLQDLLTDSKQRSELYTALKFAFDSFKNKPENELARTILQTLNKNLLATLELKRTTIESYYLAISTKLKGNALFTGLLNKIQYITTNNPASEKLRDSLNVFINKASLVSASKPKTSEIKVFIEQELKVFSEINPQNKSAQEMLESVIMIMNEALDEIVNYDVKNIISELVASYNKLEQFKNSLSHFKPLYEDLNYAQWELALEEKRDHLIFLLAEYIVREKLNLKKDIEPHFPQNALLYKQIEGAAIALGSESALVHELKLAKEKINALNQSEINYERIVAKLQVDISRLTQENQNQLQQLAAHQEDVQKLNKEKQVQTKLLAAEQEAHQKDVQKLRQEVQVQVNLLTAEQLAHQEDLQKLNNEKQVQANLLAAEQIAHQQDVQKLNKEKQVQTNLLAAEQEAHQQDVQKLRQEVQLQVNLLTEEQTARHQDVQKLNKEKQIQANLLAAEQIAHQEDVQKLNKEKQVQANLLAAEQAAHQQDVQKLNKEKQVQTNLLEAEQAARQQDVQKLNKEKQVQANLLAAEQASHQQDVQKLRQEVQVQVNLLTAEQIAHQEDVQKLNKEKQIQANLLAEEQAARQQDIQNTRTALDEKKTVAQKNQELENEITLLKQQNAQLNAVLNDEQEYQCQSLIRNKLRQLTKDYLLHLVTEIEVALKDKFNTDDIPALILRINAVNNWPQDSDSLKQKFIIVSDLFTSLRDDLHLKPSEKISQFCHKLNSANEVIQIHRDPTWQRYTTNTAIILGIILTGVLPGLAALAIFSATTGKSPMFWESAGQTFFKASTEEVAKTSEFTNRSLPNAFVTSAGSVA